MRNALMPSSPLARAPMIQDSEGDFGFAVIQKMTSGEQRIMMACHSYFGDILQNSPTSVILSHFSTMTPPILQHAHVNSSISRICKFSGLSAIRSYYDLLFIHLSREMHLRPDSVVVLEEQQAAHATSDIVWTWRLTGEQFIETIHCYVQFDEALKISAIIVTTLSDESTSVLEAIPKTWPGRSTHLQVWPLFTHCP